VKFLARDLNRRTSALAFEYRECPDCRLLFLANQPADLSRHYPAEYVRQPPSMAALARIGNKTRHQLDLVTRHVAGGKLLEIGPGYGSFLWLAQGAGFQVKAIEADQSASEFLRRAIAADVVTSAAPHEVLAGIDERFDAIVMWHSLEHLPDPWETLRQACRLLANGGALVIATPNPGAWQFRRLGRYWPHVDAPRHLWLIPFKLLRDFIQPLGLVPAFSTTTDRDGLSWNRFGWSQSLLNTQPLWLRRTLPARVAGRVAGSLVATVCVPWERRSMNGSAYTAVFHKPAA